MAQEQPKQVLGNTTRELWELFCKYAGSAQMLTQDNIRKAVNDPQINIFPSKSQIYELVYTVCENAGRVPVDHITFGEFCVFVTELQEVYRRCPRPPIPRSLLQGRLKEELFRGRQKRRLSEDDEPPQKEQPVKLDDKVGTQASKSNGGAPVTNETSEPEKIFLGGSCNPTTWRHDIAIPFLKDQEITFYNPQVETWSPQMMDIEDQAKQTAEILFFVIDNQTRSTASMVEAAYLAGSGRQLILIIRPFGDNAVIGETKEALTEIEIEDLNRSHAYLVDLVERLGIPIFTDIDTALSCTAKVVKENARVTDLVLTDGAQPIKHAHVRIAPNVSQLRSAFSTVDSDRKGLLNYRELNLAYKTITDENLPPALASYKERTFSFEDFCCIVSEYRYKRKPFLQRLSLGLVRLMRWMRGQGAVSSSQEDRPGTDAFLGGTCGPSTWRKDIAEPELRKHGISFHNPQVPQWNTRYIPQEAAHKDSCKVLLYVITPDTRGITSMLEAAYYIGLGCDVVLCVQFLPTKGDVYIENEKISDIAVKDYNRARSYLRDMANKDNIPVFEQIEEAIQCVVRKLSKS